MKYRVLVIDDEYLIRVSLREGLQDLGYQVWVAETMEEGLALAEQIKPAVVLLDNQLGDGFGMDYLETIKKLDGDIQVIMITAYGSVSQAVQAVRRGAYDYVQKPFDVDVIDITIRRALDHLNSRRHIALLSGEPPQLVGESPALQQIKRQIEVLARQDNVDVLVRGETGTGKEVVVNQIHSKSGRRDFPLVKINCGAIPDNLLESELFGYERGAFTGANKSKKGLIDLADGGTVFLDEIGEMPLNMQVKLLNFLEDRKFKRVGGLTDLEVSVRVIAATNRPLEQAIKEGKFREDLFYRLNVVQIHLPPLRKRREDIILLCDFYLQNFNRKLGKNVREIAPTLLEELLHHEWKGNVRELKNVLERAVLFCEGELLEHNGQPLVEGGGRPPKHLPPDAPAWPLADLSRPLDLPRELERLELFYIRQALDLCQGNHSKAAELLGISRFALRRRLENN